MSKSEIPHPWLILNLCLKCILKTSVVILFLFEDIVYIFTFFLERNSLICLSFHIWNYPEWKQAIACHLHFFYQLVAWTLAFNHIVIIFYVDYVTFLYQLSNTQQIMF